MTPRSARLVLAGGALALAAVWLKLNLSAGEKQIDKRLRRLYAVAEPQFRRSMSVLLGPPMLDGNRVDVLVNGKHIFPAMLEAIAAARRTITFETFIYWSGEIGERFAQALTERAAAGVKVHLLLDWVGSVRMDPGQLSVMQDAGVQVVRYHEPRRKNLRRLNNRTHRKLLIVDGEIGFTGGVGIADQWQGDAQDESHWRDTHFRIEGPTVAQMQAVFMDNWIKATGDVLHGEAYFPALVPRGELPAQMFSSSATGGSASMHLMYLMAITAAEQSIDLSTAYFVPDALAIDALQAAARRGVRVRVLVPGAHIDTHLTRRASRSRWGALLEAGVQIAEYEPTMFHCKVLVVDACWVSVGSTNFDNRSFRLNDEANLNVLDADFARSLIDIFEADLRRAQPTTLETWRHRPWPEKLAEQTASLIGSQL